MQIFDSKKLEGWNKLKKNVFALIHSDKKTQKLDWEIYFLIIYAQFALIKLHFNIFPSLALK